MIEIKLTELPEFDKQLKITITLEKDEEGIKESVTTFPGPPSSSSWGSSFDNVSQLPEKEEKKERKTRTVKSQPSTNTGDGIVGSVDPIPSTHPGPISEIQSTNTPTKSKRRSGNLMDLEF